LIEEYRKLESIEDAWMEETGDIVVKFKKGGHAVWHFIEEIEPPAYFDMDEITQFTGDDEEDEEISPFRVKNSTDLTNRNFPKVETAAILNVLDDQKIFADQSKPIAKYLKYCLERAYYPGGEKRYSCKIISTNQLDLDFFATKLSDYGVICLFTHGGILKNKNHVLICTGDQAPKENTMFYNRYFDDWNEGRVFISTMPKYGDNADQNKRVYSITEEFIAKNSFKNTVFYTAQCYGMAGNILGRKLKDRGASVVIGYDNINTMGVYASRNIFEGLCGGYTVKETLEKMVPDEALVNTFRNKDDGNIYTARLKSYPENSDAVLVVRQPQRIEVYNSRGEIRDAVSVETTRAVSIEGDLIGFENTEKITAKITVNGSTSILKINAYMAFKQEIGIRGGENRVKISATGYDKNTGSAVVAGKEMTITGDFPPFALYTELAWNTQNDVDLHLTGPDGTDCYYARKTVSSWGGYLDVDNIVAYGPEHITIPELKMPGRYTLWVHYYADRGKGASNASVLVETQNESNIFTGRLNVTGDKWTVCYIDFYEQSLEKKVIAPSSGLKNSALPVSDLPEKKPE
jgi:uncharacterized protein YfaP (DUF2135 family)